MSELELRLTQLGRELDVPAPPDVAPAVLRRIGEAPTAPFWRRRALLVAVAAVLVAAGAVLAVPPARSAVFDFFGIGSAEIRIVDELPAVESGPLEVGEPTTLDAARKRVPGLLEPHGDAAGTPDHVYLHDYGRGTPVTFVWGDPERPRLLLTQVRGRYYFEKLVRGTGGKVVVTDVNGADAVWIEGEPHVVFVQTDRGGGIDLPGRLARNSLVWSRGPVTMRLEGDISREDAERIARTVR
jgi:anti-sigma factor RsiW